MHTGNDLIISFRGMDSRRDVQFMDTQTAPVYDASLFGQAAVDYAASLSAPKTVGNKPNPDAFWVLDGYAVSYEAIQGPVVALIQKWEANLSPNFRVWFVGHSDGSQLAQLAALKWAVEKGAASVGGVVLFGPSRVGSKGFAQFYNTLLGERTVYYSYGRDPAASTDYTIEQVGTMRVDDRRLHSRKQTGKDPC